MCFRAIFGCPLLAGTLQNVIACVPGMRGRAVAIGAWQESYRFPMAAILRSRLKLLGL